MRVYWSPVNGKVTLQKIVFIQVFDAESDFSLFSMGQHQHHGVAQSFCLLVIQQQDSGIEGQVETISHIKSPGNSAQSSFI